MIILKENERLDDLQTGGLYIIQDTESFCFGLDAVLLSSFADVKCGDEVLDLCTGTGIIPILLTAKTKGRSFCGIEILHDMAEMAKRSVLYNGLTNVEIIEGDAKECSKIFSGRKFDHITCNPPYIKGGGIVNPNNQKAVSRHEILIKLDDVIKNASYVLNFGGKFSMVHRPDRLADVIDTMRKYKLEPKRLRMVHSSFGKEAKLFLIEGAMGGGTFLKVLPPLYIYEKDGEYTEEVLKIYGKA